MNFAPLHLHTVYSMLDGVGKPNKIASRCKELGYNACAVTDHGSISSAVKFIKACKAEQIKPIIGCEFYVANGSASDKDKNRKPSHQIILAKNLSGWRKLIKLVTLSNEEENFYYHPRIDREMLETINPGGDLISFSGHPGSTIATSDNPAKDVEYMKALFGVENFMLEVQRVYGDGFKFCMDVSNRMRELADQTRTKRVATGDSHYVNKEDAILQRIVLCSSLKKTMKEVQRQVSMGDEGSLSTFFKSDRFHIPSIEDLLEVGNTEDELENAQLIADMCESYDITGPPKLPKYIWTNGYTELGWLKELCTQGMIRRGLSNRTTYVDRLQYELKVIEDANLAGYFLIVQDYVKWTKDQGWLVGPGRGSAAGCLISYLIGITSVDPIRYGLLFERFYNAGRKGSLPDIDIDFQSSKRDLVIDYIRNRYGEDYVAQIVTFSRMQGKGALKEVLRNNNVCDFDTMNTITKDIPEEAAISDLLEEEQEESIIRWTLRNEPGILQDWCRLEEDGSLTGEYAKHFGYAIELEGVLRSTGKHAAGVVVSSDIIGDVCPMIRDKNSGRRLAAMDMNSLADMGLNKFDILALSALDKLKDVNTLLMKGML